MPITRENLTGHELIGLHVEIVKSSDKSLVGVRGKITDETKNTFSLEKENGKEIVISKSIATFRFALSAGEAGASAEKNEKIGDGTHLEIKGADLVAQPEARLKKCRLADTKPMDIEPMKLEQMKSQERARRKTRKTKD